MSPFAFQPAVIYPGAAQLVAPMALAPGGNSLATSRSYDVIDSIAVIGVYGLLVDSLPWDCGRWATGYDRIAAQLSQAFYDADVKGIVLDIDSCGGMVSGCFDLVDWIAQQKLAAGKPLAAILTECAYSGAYAIASVADDIVVPRTGGVGSIGVVMTHIDMSGMLEQAGIKVTVLTAGAHKADGNPYEPLPAGVRAEIDTRLEAVRQLFAQTVVKNRTAAGHAITLAEVLATEGRIYSGPDGTAEAVRLGLADEVMAPQHAFDKFRDEILKGR